MFCFGRTVILSLIFVTFIVQERLTLGENTTYMTTDEYVLITTQQPEVGFTCTGSNITYGLDDLCDGNSTCPEEDDEFLCSSRDVRECHTEELHCFNKTVRGRTPCVHLTVMCDGEHCRDERDEMFCDAAITCGSTCSFCTKVSASCDMAGPINSLERLTLPSTIRYLKLTNFSNIQSGLPISNTDYPLLNRLILSRNDISEVGQRVFREMSSLRILDLSHNIIRTFQDGAFEGLYNLVKLELTGNMITSLTSNYFQGMPNLEYLFLSENKITSDGIESGAFRNIPKLKRLFLMKNEITVVRKEFFSNLHFLDWLDLGHNKIESLSSGTFEDLGSIVDLILRNNSLSRIEPGAFRGLDKITGISFTDNKLTELRVGMLDGLCNVEWISFRRNPLTYIEPGAFDNLTNIQYLLLVEVRLDYLEPDMFRGIKNIRHLSTDDYRLCCLFDATGVCSNAQVSALDSCTRLMPNTVLRVAMWVLGFGALLGNTMVIFLRCSERRSKRRSQEQPFFISNLAIADWIMGVFMITIASADIYYGEYYFLKAPHWRSSAVCKFAGVIAILSSESSVFLLTIITLDRFVSVMFPFSKFKFHARSARACVVIMWFVTILLSLGPVIIGTFVPGFYGLSDVCIGLPLSLDSTATGTLVYDYVLAIPVFTSNDDGSLQPSWLYSIVLFLGINLLCFLFILICYIIIFIQVKRSASSIGKDRNLTSPREQEVKIALKMAIIVGTDFCCWMPVIIMGILSQTGLVAIPVSLYAWCAVFILPINATLNPYLYTFTAFIGQKRRSNVSQKSMNTGSTISASRRSEYDTRF